MTEWMEDRDKADVVLATLADGLLKDLEPIREHLNERIQLSIRQMDEALSEFYALTPHLSIAKERGNS